MEQCLWLSSGSVGTELGVHILEALTASRPLGTLNHLPKATLSRVALAFVLFQALCRAELVVLFSRREVGVEWGDKIWRKPKVLGLKCLSQRRRREWVCVLGGDGLALPSAGSHSWDHFVLLQWRFLWNLQDSITGVSWAGCISPQSLVRQLWFRVGAVNLPTWKGVFSFGFAITLAKTCSDRRVPVSRQSFFLCDLSLFSFPYLTTFLLQGLSLFSSPWQRG